MEFGRVDDAAIGSVDFTLPPDAVHTLKVLGGKKATYTEVYVGCAKWGRKEWVGKIYPKGTKEKDFLEAYGRQFNCIEFNAVFYKLPSHHQVRAWRSKVKPDFKFCPKFTDVITHIKRLQHAECETSLLLDVLRAFEDQLGPMFLMPHPQMGPGHYDTITGFLQSLPEDIEVFLELRHPDWFIPQNMEKILAFCRQNRTGMVITDTSGRRDCAHMELTIPEAFVRFVGNGLHPTDYTRIDEWVQRIRQWKNTGLERLWFFMHQHDEQYSPELCKYLVDELNTHCETRLKSPVFATETNATLF